MSAYVPRRLTETFLSVSAIDFSLELRHLGIRTSLNEVWLLTPAQELEHIWGLDQVEEGEWMKESGVLVVGVSELGFHTFFFREGMSSF